MDIDIVKKNMVAALIAAALICLVADGADLRGEMATVGSDFTWTHQNFPGFYYDLDEDLGTETLQIDSAGSSADIRYSSTVQNSYFQFQDWGYYRVLGFMGQRCFAGYISSEDSWFNTLFEESDDKDLLSGGYISKILLDDDSQRVVATGEPLKLEQGYELLIKKISDRDRKVSLDLLKDGQSVDSRVLSPSKDGATMSDKTYCYKRDLGEAKGIVTLAIHFKNAYNDTDVAVVTIDGLWQISDEPISLKAGEKLGLMNVVDSSEAGLSLASEGPLNINKGEDLQLMASLNLRAADQQIVDQDNPLRYYPYIKAADSEAEVRGSVAAADYTWNAQNFAGFYYDINDNIGTETLSAKVTEGNILSGDFPYGITYQTSAQRKAFSFQDWGYYNAIGFLSKNRFAGYSDDEDYEKTCLYQRSRDENSLASQQLLDILMDDNREQVLSKGDKLELKDGYELKLVGIDFFGRVFVELFKDGELIDSRVLAPGAEGATVVDKTYFLLSDVGDQKDLVTIAVHFKTASRDEDEGTAVVDGIWQLSTEPISVASDEKYGLLAVQYTSQDSIIMANKDATRLLTRGKSISLMPGVAIQTADNDTLMYYLRTE